MADPVGHTRLRRVRWGHRPPLCPGQLCLLSVPPRNSELRTIPEITTVGWSSHPHPVPFLEIKWGCKLPEKRHLLPLRHCHCHQVSSRHRPRAPVLCVRSDSIISNSSQNVPNTERLLCDINSVLWEKAMEGYVLVLTTVSQQLPFSGILLFKNHASM